jgi:hypothetical protein
MGAGVAAGFDVGCACAGRLRSAVKEAVQSVLKAVFVRRFFWGMVNI